MQETLEENTNNLAIKCNNDFNGFYLIKYSDKLSENLGKALSINSSMFSTADRAFLIYKSYLLAFSGLSSYKTPAVISTYLLKTETSYLPFSALFFHLNKIADILENRNQFFEFNVN